MSLSTRRKLFLGLSGLFLVLAVAVWVFFAFYFDDVFDRIAREKLSTAVSSATHGTYELALKRITYSHGVVIARGFEFKRVGYRAEENGLTVREVSIDSVRLAGVNVWDIVFGRPLTFANLLVNDPSIHSCWLGDERAHLKLLPPDTVRAQTSNTPSISLDTVIFKDVRFFSESSTGDVQTGMVSLKTYRVKWDSKTIPVPGVTSKGLQLAIPSLDFTDSAGLYVYQIRNLVANTEDSLLTIDSIGYNPTQTLPPEEENDFQFAGVRVEGIDFAGLLAGKGVAIRSCTAHTWRATQNTLPTMAAFPIRVGLLDLPEGNLRLSLSTGASMLFTDINLTASEFQFDPKKPSKEPLYSKQVVLDIPELRYDANGALLKLSSVHGDMREHLLTMGSAAYSTGGSEYRLAGTRAEGIDFGKLLDGNGLSLGVLKTASWSAVQRSVSGGPKRSGAKRGGSKPSASSGDIASSISFPIHVGRIDLPHGTIQYTSVAKDSARTASTMITKGVSVGVWEFNLDPKSLRNQSMLFSKQVKFRVPSLSFDDGKGLYTIELRNLQGNLRDSLVTIDSLGYIPKLSEDGFAARYQYPQARTDFRCANIRAEGIYVAGLLSGRRVAVRSVVSSVWTLDSYTDKRMAADPHPPEAFMVNDLVRKIKFPITVRTIALKDGYVRYRERAAGSAVAGVLNFDHLNIIASPFTTDSRSALYQLPMQLDLHGVFVGQSVLAISAQYPLHDSAFNLTMDATVGPFSVNRVNTFLVPNERKEIADGQLDTACLKMEIVAGTSTTTLTPRYHQVSMKVLAADSKDSAGIIEGISTLAANTFILRKDNPGDSVTTVVTATTTRTRAKEEELFQFIWFSLRAALGTVVGGFK